MIKKTYTFLSTHRREVFRYLMVGGSGFFLDVGVLYLIKQVVGASAIWGVVCSQTVVIIYNFFLNKYWSFQSVNNVSGQFVRYLCVVAMNYCAGVSAMYLLHDIFGYHYIGVRIITVGFFVPINFLLYKYWIYKKNTVPQNS